MFQRFCAVCHGPRGEGAMGPPLTGISARLSNEQITHQLREPRASMPALYPAPVDDVMLQDLLTFLKGLK